MLQIILVEEGNVVGSLKLFFFATYSEGHRVAVGVCIMMTTSCPLLLRKMQGKLSLLHLNK